MKTGRTAVSARAAAEHPQLAVYQLAAALGAFGELRRARGAARAGPGWCTSPTSGADGQAKEPVQPPLDADRASRAGSSVLQACADETSGAQFVARVGPDCDRCPVRAALPRARGGPAVPEA